MSGLSFQLRVDIRRVLPYLVSLRRQVHVVVILVVKRAALLVEHITQVLLVALEEHLVTAHDMRVLVYTASGATAGG